MATFNNELFNRLSTHLGEYEKIYHKQEQKIGKNIEGLVCVDYYSGENKDDKYEDKEGDQTTGNLWDRFKKIIKND